MAQGPPQVLNAFRHHRGRHPPHPSAHSRLRYVLNAFRHHRGRHPAGPPGWPCRRTCSTPFGITEVGTTGWDDDGTGGTGAQRLSASQRSARGRVVKKERPRPCAQRLSASQRSAQYIRGPASRPAVRAQRLSASQRSALPHRARRGDLVRVLNAFRHHRGRHSRVAKILPAFALCSTPFGITEVGTRSISARHSISVACSTPFGITEVGTSLTIARAAAAVSAQRLSASQRSARNPPARVPWHRSGAQRLSASQRSAPPSRASLRAQLTCAQRLSASQRSAPRRRSSPGARA